MSPSLSPAEELLEQLTAAYEPYREARSKISVIALECIRAIAREHAPTAVAVVLDDSDQEGMGYVFSHFEDADGEEVDVEEPEEMWRPVSDLDEDDVTDYKIEVNP